MYHGQYVKEKKFILNCGTSMPAVGLSTYKSRSEAAVHEAVDRALAKGYRRFDTSPLFSNEKALRSAFANLLPCYNLERSDIFITSKLIAMDDDDDTTVRSMFQESLENLGMEYIDLYLISSTIESAVNIKEAWESLRSIQSEGLVMSIGVANFSMQQLKYIMEDSAFPSVHQLEWHPHRYNRELLKFCTNKDIHLQAYSPFGTPFASNKLLFHNALLNKLAQKYEVPISQIMIMWSLQQNVSVVTSSQKPEHLRENIDFNLLLSSKDVHRINRLAPKPHESDPEI